MRLCGTMSWNGVCVVCCAECAAYNTQEYPDVISLITGHNALRRHLYVMRLSNNPICRKCGTEEETSVHVLCECEAVASLTHI